MPSGTRSSPARRISRSARTIAGSKRSKLMPGVMISSRSCSAGKRSQRIARDMLRDGDHRIGARLAPLDETAGEIGGEERPVQGRDPLDAETTRQRARHPAGRRRPRLDDVDLRVAQAGRELAGQGQPSPHRVRPVGQFEMAGAQPQKVGHHAAAGRGHDRRAAGGDHGLRGLERGAGQAATGQGRNDLKQGGRGHGLCFWLA